MEQHKTRWQQFAKSGDPMLYLAYKQSRLNKDGTMQNNVRNNAAQEPTAQLIGM